MFSYKMSINIYNMYTPEAYFDYVIDNMSHNDIGLGYMVHPDTKTEYLEMLEDKVKNGDINVENVQKSIHNIILSSITNVLRPHIYSVIDQLNTMMKPFGQFIISGGEAFNINVPREQRKVTPDIDTKFIPFFHRDVDELTDDVYLAFMMKAHEFFWFEAMETVLNNLNDPAYYTNLYYNVLKPLEACLEFTVFNTRFLHPSVIQERKPFQKRLSIMPKNTDVDAGSVFFDINLFAIDMVLEGYTYPIKTMSGDQVVTSAELVDNGANIITGLLDLPFMRPGEFGYDIGEPGNNIKVSVTTKIDDREILGTCLEVGKTIDPENLPIYQGVMRYASARFLSEDIDAMLSLNLRKDKSNKDYYRQNRLAEGYRIPTLPEGPVEKIPKLTLNDISGLTQAVFNDNVNPMSLSKTLKYIAPPTLKEFGQKGVIEGNCVDNLPLFVRVATGSKFNYMQKTWVNCCDSPDKTNYCCDMLSSQFEFRLNSKEIGTELYKRNPQMIEVVDCILQSLYDFLKKIKKDMTKPEKSYSIKERLGRMVYNYNNEYSTCVSIPTLVSNILIIAQNLRFGSQLEIKMDIIELLLDIRDYYLKNVGSTAGIDLSSSCSRELYGIEKRTRRRTMHKK